MYFRLEIKHLTSFHLSTMFRCCLTYLVPEIHLKMSVWRKILQSVENLMGLRASSPHSLNEITTCFKHCNTLSERGDKCMQHPFICFCYIDVWNTILCICFIGKYHHTQVCLKLIKYIIVQLRYFFHFVKCFILFCVSKRRGNFFYRFNPCEAFSKTKVIAIVM